MNKTIENSNVNTDFNTDDIYESKDYKKSRKAYIWQCTFEYLVTILVSDAFLAKLLSSIGMKDGLIGIISSFITLAFLFQLFSIFFVDKITNTKKTVIFFSTLSQLLFMCLYLVPFLPFNKGNKTILTIVCVLLAYFGNYFVASILFKWANSYVNPEKRGEYSAGKEMVSLITGMVFTLIVGHVIDGYEALDNIHGGFLFTAAAIFILSVCNFVSLLLIKNDKADKNKKKSKSRASFADVINNTVKNKSFLRVVIMTCLWDISRYLTTGFLGTFKTKDLLMSVGTVQIINIGANLCRFFISKPFGRYSDKTSYTKGIELAYFVAAAAFAVNAFTTSKTWWCIVIYTVLFNVSIAGTNQNYFNITYSYVKSDYFVQATAIKNSIGGICGFAASVLGSKILGFVQARQNMFFGVHIYGQQLLSAISCVLILLSIFYVHFVVEKQKVMKQ